MSAKLRKGDLVVLVSAERTECGPCEMAGWHEGVNEPWCVLFNEQLRHGVDATGKDPGCEHEEQRLAACLASEVER